MEWTSMSHEYLIQLVLQHVTYVHHFTLGPRMNWNARRVVSNFLYKGSNVKTLQFMVTVALSGTCTTVNDSITLIESDCKESVNLVILKSTTSGNPQGSLSTS